MRLAMMMGITLAMSGPSWSQIGTPDAHSEAPRARWHKFIDKEYGVSFLYPDTYTPTVDGNRCQSNDYRKYLLCLAPVGGSDPVISVGVTVAGPFHVPPGSGGVMPTRQRIGRHVFYCGLFGSMGVGFSDTCILNLKGKTLQFQFDAPDGVSVGDKTKQLETAILKTLRIF
jgi:hypothetical protein